MTRVRCQDGIVHFRNPVNPVQTLCGFQQTGTVKNNLFLGRECEFFPEASDRVNCPDCARVVCAVRNEPYNTIVSSVTDKALDQGIFDAVKPDGKVTHNDQA